MCIGKHLVNNTTNASLAEKILTLKEIMARLLTCLTSCPLTGKMGDYRQEVSWLLLAEQKMKPQLSLLINFRHIFKITSAKAVSMLNPNCIGNKLPHVVLNDFKWHKYAHVLEAKVLNRHHWARWPAEGKSILCVFWFLLVTILLGAWPHRPSLQGQHHFQFFIHATSPLCVLTLFCLFPVRTYAIAFRGHLDKPGPPHVKTFNLLSSSKKKKKCFLQTI